MYARMIRYSFVLTLIASAHGVAAQAPLDTTVIAWEEKVELINGLKETFPLFDLREYTNISFLEYHLPFVNALPDKLSNIIGLLKHGDFDHFLAQINAYEEQERANVELDTSALRYRYIPMSTIRSLGTNYTDLWTNFRRSYGKKSILYVSKPLFSKDAQLALIEIQTVHELESKNCKGFFAFTRSDGRWQLLKEL
jgi:hypothetical protein